MLLVVAVKLRGELEPWVGFVELSAAASKSFRIFLGLAEEILERVSDPSLDALLPFL